MSERTLEQCESWDDVMHRGYVVVMLRDGQQSIDLRIQRQCLPALLAAMESQSNALGFGGTGTLTYLPPRSPLVTVTGIAGSQHHFRADRIVLVTDVPPQSAQWITAWDEQERNAAIVDQMLRGD